MQVALSSKESLRKEVAILKQATADQQATRRADLENVEHRHKAAIATLEAAYKADLESSESRQNRTISILEASHQTDLDAIKTLHETTLATLKASDDAKMKELKQAMDRATKAMQNREATLTTTQQDSLSRIIALQKDITSIKNKKGDSQDPRSKASTLAKELRSTKSSLSKSQQECHSLRKQLEEQETALTTAQQTSASLRQQLKNTQSTHSEQASAAHEAREAEWRRRIDILLADREKLVAEHKALLTERKTLLKDWEKMSKILMHEWGKKEVGPPDEKGQPYRYKYMNTERK